MEGRPFVGVRVGRTTFRGSERWNDDQQSRSRQRRAIVVAETANTASRPTLRRNVRQGRQHFSIHSASGFRSKMLSLLSSWRCIPLRPLAITACCQDGSLEQLSLLASTRSAHRCTILRNEQLDPRLASARSTMLSLTELPLPQPLPPGPTEASRPHVRVGSHAPHASRLQARDQGAGPSAALSDSSSAPRWRIEQREDCRVGLAPRIHRHHRRTASPEAHPPEPAPHAVDRVGPARGRVCARVVHVGDAGGDEVEDARHAARPHRKRHLQRMGLR
jgi:hypothetical protein